MAEFLGANFDSFIPKGSWLGIGSGWGMWALLFFVVCLIAFLVIFLLHDRKVFNKKIIVFENISGQGFQPTIKDRARLITLGDGGEELLFLKKKKLYRTAYGRKMGTNTYWFAIGQDGYWYNVVLGDVDAKMGMLDIEPIDRDMRYMHVAIRKNIEKRYKKEGFMEKYGTIIVSGMFLLMILLGMYFIMDKIALANSASAGAVQTADKVMQSTLQVLSSLDRICSGGTGLVPAG